MRTNMYSIANNRQNNNLTLTLDLKIDDLAIIIDSLITDLRVSKAEIKLLKGLLKAENRKILNQNKGDN